MRARDVQAIAICVVATLAVALGSLFLLRNYAASLLLTAACAAVLLTRPRMLRVYRRMRGEPGWSGYYDNLGTRFKPPPAPGTAPRAPRPVERP